MTDREDRVVYVCGCIDDPQGMWFDKDVGSACRECGAVVEAINIDALLRVVEAARRGVNERNFYQIADAIAAYDEEVAGE